MLLFVMQLVTHKKIELRNLKAYGAKKPFKISLIRDIAVTQSRDRLYVAGYGTSSILYFNLLNFRFQSNHSPHLIQRISQRT
jgi:hypothetical protein